MSQFTLYGKLKGNKVDFHRSMGPGEAAEFYAQFVDRVRQAYESDKVFGKS